MLPVPALKKLKIEDEQYSVWALLRRVNDVLENARNGELRRYGLNARQASTLFMIEALDRKATPAELARWQFRKPHTVSDVLKTMEKEGLIEKSRDLDRRNQVRAVLTKKGKEASEKAARRESIHYIVSALSPEEIAQLRSLLELLGDKAEQLIRFQSARPGPESPK